jgi:LuxR family maltose regulon positive regulatory protein
MTTQEAEPTPGRQDAPILLATKLHPPVVPTQIVPRERLFARLDEGRGRRLSLVACPAGFGKSTLLAAWREASAGERPMAWVTLDEGDNDVVVLWSHVLEALGQACPGLEAAPLQALVPVAPLAEVVLPRLVNELVQQGEAALILDDFHRLASGPARESLDWFIQRLPSSFQLVLASRMDPALPLGTLRARGELLELRADELRFTDQEAAEFLNERLGLALDPGDLELLVARTEGWPAGLYLAALSLEGKPDKHALVAAFDGTSTHVVDFLAEDVLNGYDADLQAFMLRTSVLERLCPALCDEVLGQPGANAALEALARSNLFLIPLDEHRQWFRFHHLFAQILRVELERREPALVRDLHRRAYRWHRTSGTTEEAIHHALAAQAFDDAGGLILETWLFYVNAGRTATVLDWLRAFPDAALERDRRVLGVKAWVSAMQGQTEEQLRAVSRLRALGGLDEGPLPDGMASLESSLSLLTAIFGGTGSVASALEHGTRAATLEGPDSPWYPVATWVLGWAHYCNDELDLAERRFRETVTLGPPSEQWLVTTASVAQLSMIAGLRGLREDQQRLAEEAFAMAREHGLLDSIEAGEVPTAKGLALAARGRYDEALAYLEKGLMLRRMWGQPLDPADGLIALGAVTAAAGDRAAAAAHFDEAEALLGTCEDPGVLPQRLAAARRTSQRQGDSELSERELAVLRLLSGGSSEREIGQQLYVSFNTVHSHVKSIYRKLGVSSRADALERARDELLIP